MHFFLPLLTVFLFTITLSGQDSTDHVAYLPAGSVRVESGRPDNADTRFLSAI
ncbi:MAG: hypothetical protein WA952_16475 [Lewinella sp.]